MRAFRLAYDGTAYRGFQRQPHGETVEDDLFCALRDLGVLDGDGDGGAPDGYAAAGRTDRGVSAVGQVVAFEPPDWLTPRALNGGLPPDVRAWAHADCPPEFHATHHARSRTYSYYLYAPEASLSTAMAACDRLSGEHDFHNLTPDDEGTVRRLAVAVGREEGFLVFTLRAGGFSRQLARRVVSMVEAVARGERDLAFTERVLSAERLDGPDGVPPAPPEGLVFLGASYPSLAFRVDPEAAASARSVFGTRRDTAATRARVTGVLADSVGRH